MRQSFLSASRAENAELSPVQQLLRRVGGEGKFQLRSFWVFCLLWFLTSWLLLGMSFFFDDDFICADPLYSNDKECYKHICGLKPNKRKAAISSHSQSIAFAFQDYMICDQFEDQIPILQSMLFFGALIGFFVIPNIADNSGRKGAIRMAWIIGIVAIVATMMADSPRIIGFGFFFLGFGTNPAITLAFSFINEQTLGKARQRYGVGVQIGLAVGEATIALIFLTSLNWRQIMGILLGLFIIAYIPLQILIKQSPMFLVEKNPHEAIKLLNYIAKVNNQDLISQEDFFSICPPSIKQPNQSMVNVTDLFRYKSLRWISISTGIIFFGIQTIYYSTTLNLGQVGFSKTINQVIFGVSEMLGYISAEFIIHKTPRKKASIIGLGAASGLCLLLGILVFLENDDNHYILQWVEAAGLVLNRFVLCGFWSIFFVFVAQLFPTKVRSLGYGWTSVTGMIGSTLSPYVTTISAAIGLNSWLPPAIIGLLSTLFIFKLPQTHGKSLKDHIQQQIVSEQSSNITS